MKTPEYYEHLLPTFYNPNATINIRSLPDKRLVWVNNEFVRDHGFTYEQVIGKTIPELFGPAASSWDMSDAFTIASGRPVTLVEPYDDPDHGFREYGITKFIATDTDGSKYLCTIGMEIKAENRRIFEKRLQELKNQVLAQLKQIALPE